MSLFSTIVTGISRRLPVEQAQARSRQRRWGWLPGWLSLLLPMSIALAIILPITLLALHMLQPDVAMWERLINGELPRVLRNTAFLVVGVGIGTLLIGTGLAWLVTAYEFPGRRWFERLFLLPLAIPGFIMGFTFVAIFEYAGPVQTWLREATGGDVSAWFPRINSQWGVVLVLTLVLYPYVYLLARAAFREQAASTFEAAQVMGYSRTTTFFRLVLPMARPSIVVGVLLAMMEAMTDYGTVSFFGFKTLSERIVVLWNAEMNAGPAIELASLMLFVAFAFILLERRMRGRARYYQQGGRGRRPARVRLTGWRGWGASGVSLLVLFAAFLMPVYQLIRWVINETRYPSINTTWQGYLELTGNTLRLGLMAAGVVVALALIIVYSNRESSVQGRRRWPRLFSRMVSLGYAMPGAVIAAGVLAFVNPIDARVTDFVSRYIDLGDTLYLLTGTIMALMYAYIVRFMAVGFGSIESSMEKVTPNMEWAARTLGAGPARVLRRVHLPLVSGGVAAGAMLVFVDVMKELPATFLLRPFGMSTLATEAYMISMEGIWDAAAVYGLTILVAGLIPVFILMRIGDDRREGT